MPQFLYNKSMQGHGPRNMDNVLDMAILGGGPAGLTAARYALFAELNVALISPDLGGKVSYPFALRGMSPVDTVWGAEMVREFADFVGEHLQHHIAERAARVLRRDDGAFTIVLENGQEAVARSIIICTGVRAERLFVDGETKYWGRGLSFSAISHAPLFKGRDVAVVGSGDRAILAVHILSRLANKVYHIAVRKQESSADLANLAWSRPNVEVFRGWEVQQIVGDATEGDVDAAEDYVRSIDLVGLNGEVRRLDVEGVCIQMALLPNNSAVRGLVALADDGHILVDQNCATDLPGIFAAGDITSTCAEQVPVSIGEGAKASLAAWRYLASL